MIPASSENIFVGAVVEKNNIKYSVYKVNSKTVWAGTEKAEKVLEEWENRPKGLKWLDFMKKKSGMKLNVFDLNIDESSFAEKEKFKSASKSKKNNRLKDCCKRQVKVLYEDYKNGKSYRYPMHCNCNNNLCIVKVEDDGRLWLRVNLDYIYYDVETSKEEYIRTITGDSKPQEDKKIA
jgi:hypothetical protein